RGVARGVDDFVFLSIGTGMGAGLVLRGELHRGHHGAAGEVDYALGDIGGELDPSGPGIEALAERLGLPPPFDARAVFTEARGGEASVLTGALAVGLRSALDSVFVNRSGAVPA